MLAMLFGCGGGGPRVHEYEDFRLIGHGKVESIQSGEISGSVQIADLWIKIGDSDPMHLPELTAEDIRRCKKAGSLEWFEEQPIAGAKKVSVEFATGQMDHFLFRDDRITSLELSYQSEIQLSNSKEGRYGSLPMSVKDATAIFGKPLRSYTDKAPSPP